MGTQDTKGTEVGASIAGRNFVREYREFFPSLVVLLVVAAFWTVGLLGGLSVLDEPQSGLRMLIGLYLMLALVAFSIILTVLAANDIATRVQQRRTTTSRAA